MISKFKDFPRSVPTLYVFDAYKFELLLIEKVNQHKEMDVNVNFWKQRCRLCCPWPKTWTFVRSIHWLQIIRYISRRFSKKSKITALKTLNSSYEPDKITVMYDHPACGKVSFTTGRFGLHFNIK